MKIEETAVTGSRLNTASLPLVSIITPTFNQGKFLTQCISSVLAQTYTNWEQIIVDDGSTDETEAIARSYTDPRIRYQRQEHVGILKLAETYNRGLRASRGELISILEGDDLWTADKLETLVPKFVDPDVVLSYGRTGILLGDRLTSKLIPSPSLERKLGTAVLFNVPPGTGTVSMLLTTIVGPFQCAVLIRRSALEAIGGFQYAKGMGAVDYPTILAVSLQGRFDYVGRVVAYWRRHPGSSSWAGHQRDVHATYDFVRSFMSDHAAQLSLSADQVHQIEHSWRKCQKRAAFNAGRYLLLQAKWREARHEFLEALWSASPSVIVGAFVGCAASLLKTDIERLMTAAGRVSFAHE